MSVLPEPKFSMEFYILSDQFEKLSPLVAEAHSLHKLNPVKILFSVPLT